MDMKLLGIACVLALSTAAMEASAAQAIGYKIDGPYDKKQLKFLFKDLVRRPVDPASDRGYFSIAHDVELRCQPATGFLATEQEKKRPATLRIAEGLYEARWILAHKSTGRIYFLLPVAERTPNLVPHSNEATHTRNHALYIAVDPEGGKLLGREILMYDREYKLLSGGWGPWHDNEWESGCDLNATSATGALAASSLTRTEFSTLQQAAQTADRNEQDRVSRSNAAFMQAEADRTRPLKIQIGAAICKLQRGVVYEGFTEGKSPDNNKIQIRIVRASFSNNGRPSSASPPGFKEQIIWEDPDFWQLCE